MKEILMKVLAEHENNIWKEFYPNTGWIPIDGDVMCGNIYAINFHEFSEKDNVKSNIGQFRVKIFHSKESVKRAISERLKKGLSTKGYKNLYSTQELWSINCKSKFVFVLSKIDYDEKGNVLDSIEFGWPPPMKHILPGSCIEKIFTIACSSPEEVQKVIKDKIEKFKELVSQRGTE